DIQTANAYLGYSYMLSGEVTHGRGIGKDLGYATANIHIEEQYKLIPKVGVYVIRTRYRGKLLYGMMNIGFNPTVHGSKRTIEVHLFDFNENLYGEELCVELLERLRDEQKFESVEDLKLQLEKDKKVSLAHIEKLHAD